MSFPLERPSPPSNKAYSGHQIKKKIMQAMFRQHEAIVEANNKLDQLIRLGHRLSEMPPA
ncbi:MAG TPA: hypothetical protein VL175_04445 [Pirellulales bacterium]|nr:hypothetical protein [Pirellulales bacterium]